MRAEAQVERVSLGMPHSSQLQAVPWAAYMPHYIPLICVCISGGGRLFKSALCVHDEGGLVVVKVMGTGAEPDCCCLESEPGAAAAAARWFCCTHTPAGRGATVHLPCPVSVEKTSLSLPGDKAAGVLLFRCPRLWECTAASLVPSGVL